MNFLGPETAQWGGGLPREGVVAEKFVPSLESLSSLGFEERNLGCPGNFAGMSRIPGGVQKVCATKNSCAFCGFPMFGEPVVTTPDSCGFRHFRGSVISASAALNSFFVAA